MEHIMLELPVAKLLQFEFYSQKEKELIKQTFQTTPVLQLNRKEEIKSAIPLETPGLVALALPLHR